MNRILRLLIGALIFFNHSLPLTAQVLSMEEAVNVTLSKYPRLVAQRSALETVRSNAQIIKDSRLPNLRLHDQINLGTANGLAGSYFSLGLIVPTGGGRRPENTMELASGNIALASADWEVYNFGRFQTEDRLAHTDIEVGEAGLASEMLAIQQTVINTYLDILWLKQTLAIETRNLARADTVRRVIGNLVNNGIRPGLDSSLATVELSRAKLNYFQMQEELQRASIKLATLTSRPVKELNIDTTFNEKALYSVASEIELTDNHPMIHYRNNVIKKQSAELDLIRKRAMPRITLLTSAWARGTSLDIDNNFGPLEKGFGYSRTNFLVGVAATVNLTDFRRTKNRITQQQWRVKEADQQLAVEKIQLENALTTADSVMSTLRLALVELPTTLNAAERAYEQRLSLYNNGIENILGLTDAMQLLSAIEKQSVNIQRRAVNAYLLRAYATSNFDDFFALFGRQ